MLAHSLSSVGVQGYQHHHSFQETQKSTEMQPPIEEFIAHCCLEISAHSAFSEAASHRRQGPGGEAMRFRCIALNHWLSVFDGSFRKSASSSNVNSHRPEHLLISKACLGYLTPSDAFVALTYTLLRIVLKLHNNMYANVHDGSSRSRRFPVKRGVKQGCVLASSLFAIFFVVVLMCALPKPSSAWVHYRTTGKLFNFFCFRVNSKVRRLFDWELFYADDAAFVATFTYLLQNLCNPLVDICAEFNITTILPNPKQHSPLLWI